MKENKKRGLRERDNREQGRYEMKGEDTDGRDKERKENKKNREAE